MSHRINNAESMDGIFEILEKFKAKAFDPPTDQRNIRLAELYGTLRRELGLVHMHLKEFDNYLNKQLDEIESETTTTTETTGIRFGAYRSRAFGEWEPIDTTFRWSTRRAPLSEFD